MADTKISALTAATTPLAGTEELPVVQGGATVRVAVSELQTAPAGSSGQVQYNNAGAFGGLNLWYVDANTLETRNATSAQTFRVYNTYTDASNYERGFVRWNSNVFEIGTEKSGSGAVRETRLIGTQIYHPNSTAGVHFSTGGTEGGITCGRASYGGYIGGWNPLAGVGGRYANLTLSGYTVELDTGLNNYSKDFPQQNGTRYFFSSSSACYRKGADMTVGAWTCTTDATVGNVTLTANSAFATAVTHISGGNVNVLGGAGASASAGAADGGHVYLDGGQGYGTGVHGNVIVGNTRGKLQLTPTTVAGLGSASTAGQRTFVTDANATTFHSVVAGGGANFVPVFSDGTDWRIG